MIKLIFSKFKWYEWLIVLLIVGFICLHIFCDLGLPEKMGQIISLVVQDNVENVASSSEIWDVGKIMLLYSLGSILCTIIVSYLAAFVATRFSARVRKDLFQKVGSFSMEEMEKFTTSSLITRSTNDITQIQQVIMLFLRMALTAPAMAIGAVIKISTSNMQLTWITAGAVGLMLIFVFTMFAVVVPKFNIMQKYTDKLNQSTRENLTGLKVVRAYSAEKLQEDKFDKVNKSYTKTELFINRFSSFLMPGMQLVMNYLSLAIMWLGSYLISDGSIDIGGLTAFSNYAIQVLFSFVMLSMLFVFIPRGTVSAKRIWEVLKTQSKIVDGEGKPETNIKGRVEFNNVSFRYPDAEGYVLKNISFKANPGQTVAFIGSTGSGKSTLINLIPRFYDATEGNVQVDGIDVRDYKISDLNDKLGYVPQKGVLFKGSIEDNIKYGYDKATKSEVDEALRISQAYDFVYKFKDKLDHEISQGGKNVSGGQKQRLSIARAIIKKPEILIFDDSFSALDFKTDKILREELKKHTKDTTKLIVAQRIGTIMDADQIIVLDKGEMVGHGTHKQLMKNCKIYQEIAYSQLSKEELR